MGDLLLLADYRSIPSRSARAPLSFYFDLGCPDSYLAAERVERELGEVEWIPAPTTGSTDPHVMLDRQHRSEIERRALALRLPLSWPDTAPVDCTAAHRVAAQAAELGLAGPFALAASRLAFSGGFDLSHPDTLIDAAAAARMPLELCRTAAEDPRWDDYLHGNAHLLALAGVRARPAIRVDGGWCAVEHAVARAAARLRKRDAVQGPLAPAG